MVSIVCCRLVAKVVSCVSRPVSLAFWMDATLAGPKVDCVAPVIAVVVACEPQVGDETVPQPMAAAISILALKM